MFDGHERTTLVAFLAMSLLAGGNAVGVRFSNRELDPMWGGAVRFSLAAALLFAIMAAMGQKAPRGRGLVGPALYGVFGFGGGFAFVYYGLVRIQAGLGQTLLALVPLLTILLASAQRKERLNAPAIVGSLVGAIGIIIVSGSALDRSADLLSVLSILAGGAFFAQGAIVVHQYPAVPPLAMNAIGMATGSAILFAASVVARETIALPTQAATWTALAFLVTIGSVGVFALYVFVLQRWKASRTAYTFVLVPISTILISAWLDDEPMGSGLILGGLLVIGGVYVGAIRPGRLDSTVAPD